MSDIEGVNMFGWHTNILATHEERQVTSLGPWQGDSFLGIALPYIGALRRRGYVKYNGVVCYVEVGDVGPWCVDDREYVEGNARPRAEILKGMFCPRIKGTKLNASVPDGDGFRDVNISNGAGIDLYPGTAKYLGITIGHNVYVDWKLED